MSKAPRNEEKKHKKSKLPKTPNCEQQMSSCQSHTGGEQGRKFYHTNSTCDYFTFFMKTPHCKLKFYHTHSTCDCFNFASVLMKTST